MARAYDVAGLARGRRTPVYGDEPISHTQPVGDPVPVEERLPVETPLPPADMPQGGSWGANYEWTASDGSPRISDIPIGNRDWVTGANTGGWGTGGRGTESMKNAFLMMASNIDPRSPDASRQLMARPEFRQFFPNAKLIEHPKGDQIDFGDGHPVDVLRNAVAGGSGDAWQWLTSGGAPAGGAAERQTSNVSSLLAPGQVRAQLPNEQLKTWTNPQTGQEEWLFADPATGEVISPEAYERLVQAGQRPPIGAVSRRRRAGASHVTDLLAPERELV